MEWGKGWLVFLKLQTLTEDSPGLLSSWRGLRGTIGVSTNDDLVSLRGVSLHILWQIWDWLQEVLIVTWCWCIERQEEQRSCGKFQLDSNNPITRAVKNMDVWTNIISPANCNSMPNMSRFCNQVFSMFKHIRCRDLESIFRKMVVYNVLFRVWEPYFLQEDYLGLRMAEKIRKIMSVPLESRQIEGEHWQS